MINTAKHCILICTAILFSSVILAQQYAITGNIVDQKDNSPLPGAHVSLMHPWGEELKTTVSDTDGRFELPGLSQGGYAIKVSFVGFADYKTEVTISNQNVDVGVISLLEGVELERVEVEGKIPLAQQLGDTTQYNADAFKVLKDASAEELVEKMPGVVVENGRVKAQGEDVKEVLVDGRPFFGNDPTAALRNLPAEVVDKIQIFDQNSDQANFTGFDDGETSKTINIITRPNMRSGQFGKVYAGGGTDERYQLGGNASIFDGDRRISIIGQTNNINQQNFATEDLLGVVGSSGRGGRGGFSGRRGGGSRGGRSSGRGGGSVRDFLVDQQGGIATTNALGVNFSDKWGEKLDISGSYFFNNTDNTAENISSTEYIDNELVSQFYNENNTSQTDNFNHRLNFRINYEIDSSNSIIMRPRLSFQKNKGVSNTFGQTFQGSDLLSQTDNQYRSDLSGMDFSNSLVYRHRFAKERRTISLDFRQGYNDKKGESFLNSSNVFYDGLPMPDTIDQFSSLDISGWSLSGNLAYTEPVGENSMLMFNYRSTYSKDDSDKQTFDFEQETQEYSSLNETLTNVFTNEYQTQQFGSGYNFRKGRDLIIMARANLQWSTLNSQEIIPSPEKITRNYFDVLPMAMLRYNISRQENLRLFYMGRTQIPSVEQLQNVIDNSNPLQISIGNPKLDRSYTHRFSARYSKSNTEKATVLFLLLGFNYSDSYISNSVYLRETDNPIFEEIDLVPGGQLTLPINQKGYWSSNVYGTYGFPVKAIKSNLNFDFSATFSRTPGLINDELNYSNARVYAGGITVSSNFSEKVDFTLSTRSSFNDATNSLRTPSDLESQYLNQSSRLKFNWVLPAGIVWRTELTHQYYTGLADGFDDSFFLWSAGIGKKLFKNELGEITLSVFDILEQNQSISRNITETYIEDLRSIVLQRYVMLTFTYNFRNFSTKKKETEQEDRRRDRMPWMRND